MSVRCQVSRKAISDSKFRWATVIPCCDYDARGAVQARAESHNRRALLHGDQIVLAGPHRQLAQAVLAGELAERREMPRLASGVGASGGIVISPDDLHRAALEEPRQLRRGDPALARLAGDVDLDQDLGVGGAVPPELLERRLARDRLDVADVRQELADLAALKMADEVPGERARVRLAPWPRAPARGSRRPARCRPRRAPPSSSTGTYLTAARICTSAGSRPAAAISARTRSRFARTSLGP